MAASPLRTARGFDYGTALSLVSEEEEERLAAVEGTLRREAAGEQWSSNTHSLERSRGSLEKGGRRGR